MAKTFFVRLEIHRVAAAYYRSSDRAAWAEAFFSTLEDGCGENELALEMLQEANEFSASRSEAGRRGMSKRWGDRNQSSSDNSVIANGNSVITNDNQKQKQKQKQNKENTIGQKQVLTDLFPEEIPAVNSSKIDKEQKTLSTFEAFWENYPRKQGRVPALRIWRSMSQDDRAAAAAALPAYTRSISDPQFYQHGDTFLRKQTFKEVTDPQTDALRTSFRKLTEMGCTEQQIETDMNRHYGADWKAKL